MYTEKNQILINATQAGEIRVALLEGGKLADLDIEYAGHEQKKSNIYKGRISRIEPSLEAAFVDYGAERHGFLPFKEITLSAVLTQQQHRAQDSQPVKNALRVGQEVMVQIEKEERGNKGAALTSYITLPGSYLVLMPNNPGSGGISRRIEGEERREMQNLLSQMPVLSNMGLILRTAGVGRTLSELKNDLDLLLQQWDAISQAFHTRPSPFLIFQEGDLITRSIRDYLRRDIDEIIIDDEKIYEKTKQYIEQIRPDFLSRITYYNNPVPLFLHFDVEKVAESAFQREIRLASGGTIVIDKTEALVAIDINSGRSTKNEDIEETAVKTNLEAAREIAHQLRMRDLGGLIVIDFIDMNSAENQLKVENCLREATRKDRARVQIGHISSFGLLEMSRQRLRHSLGKANEALCPHCDGQGTIRSIESLTLSLLRLVEKEALKGADHQIRIEASVALVTYLMNEKRAAVAQIERRYQIAILLIPNPHWHASQYKITTLSKSADTAQEHHVASYRSLEDKSHPDTAMPYAVPSIHPVEVPAVKSLAPFSGKSKPTSPLGIINRLLLTLTNIGKSKKIAADPSPNVKKLGHNPRTPHPSRRRYDRSSGGSRNNRARQSREVGGSPAAEYHTAPASRTGQHHRPARTKPFTHSRRVPPQAGKRPSEVTSSSHESQSSKRQESQATHKQPIHFPERQTVLSIPQTAHIIPDQLPQDTDLHRDEPKNSMQRETTPSTAANSTPTNALPFQRRKSVRRFGGEPKLRRRNYVHNEHDAKKDK